MSSQADLDRRARRYWYEDGFVEIALGGLLAGLGILLGLDALATAGALPGVVRILASVLLVVLVLGGVLASRPAIRASKERVTYPRTGFVAYRHQTRPRRVLAAALVASVGLVSVAVLASPGGTPGRVVGVEALTLSGTLVIPAWRFGLGRFYALAAVTAAGGCLAVILAVPDTGRSALLYVIAGVALLVSGSWTLRAYLRQTGDAPNAER